MEFTDAKIAIIFEIVAFLAKTYLAVLILFNKTKL